MLVLPKAFLPAVGPTQRPNQWILGYLSLGINRPRREADHSSPSSGDVISKAVLLFPHIITTQLGEEQPYSTLVICRISISIARHIIRFHLTNNLLQPLHAVTEP
jgi:hypothetical protein